MFDTELTLVAIRLRLRCPSMGAVACILPTRFEPC
jgi:hypothetical protein